MQVSVTNAEGLKRSLTIAVPAQRIEQAVKTRLQDLGRRVKMPGFRPGKVPSKVVEKRYGASVRQEVLGKVMQDSFYEAITQEKLSPIGGPKIETICADPGKDLEYKADFEIYPEISLSDVKSLKLTVPRAVIEDAQIDETIENLRKSYTDWNEVDREASDGDQVTIDYKGSIDGELFEGGSAENIAVVLGQGGFLEDFEKALYGAKKDEDIQFQLSFPDDYVGKQVAGKTADFEVKVHKVCEPELPEVDKSFIEKIGVEEGTLEKLKETVRKGLESKLEHSLKDQNRQIVMEALFKANEVQLPESLVQRDTEHLMQETMNRQKSITGHAEEALKPEDFKEKAERRVSLSLILGELVKQQKFQADQRRVQEIVYTLAQSAPNPREVIEYYLQNKQNLSEIESIALEEKVVEWVLENADVTYEDKAYKDILESHAH